MTQNQTTAKDTLSAFAQGLGFGAGNTPTFGSKPTDVTIMSGDSEIVSGKENFLASNKWFIIGGLVVVIGVGIWFFRQK
jgi:hypothetical protein